VFFFNLLVGTLFYLLLFAAASAISSFFDEPQLKLLLQVIGLGLIVNAFTIIQRTILTKRIDFKLQTRISLISSLISGAIGIGMAYAGYGVWSLVIRTLTGYSGYGIVGNQILHLVLIPFVNYSVSAVNYY
jgi:O-antigen/teichoic acid export membrane protein